MGRTGPISERSQLIESGAIHAIHGYRWSAPMSQAFDVSNCLAIPELSPPGTSS